MRSAAGSSLLCLLVATAALVPPAELGFPGGAGLAWADDDDDDGGSGGGGGGGGSGGGNGGGGDDDDDDDTDEDRAQRRAARQARQAPQQPQQIRRTQARRAAPSTPAPPPPVLAGGEIVALDLSAADLATLLGAGFAVIEERTVPALGVTARRLDVPDGVALADARETVRALPSGQDADFNHYYRSEQGFAADCAGADCPARLSIGWPAVPSRAAACGATVTIGMIDTGINETHETFRGANIEVHRRADAALDPSRAVHGTAVAALLVGDPATRAAGLVPGARLIAVDAFHRAGSDERADAFTLVDSLGFLADRGATVINLSLAGPPNTVLAEVVDRLTVTQDIVLVSAAGNGGPRAEPFFPAAYDPVIAVTAVDRVGNVYRRAGQGPHIDLAAPGVDVWTAASVSGARWKTGTSFAVPFVTAAAAMLRETEPELSAAGVAEALRARAVDLGTPGPDPVFGAGRLSLGAVCNDAT